MAGGKKVTQTIRIPEAAAFDIFDWVDLAGAPAEPIDPLAATPPLEQRVVIEARREILIRCGKASILLTRDGEIVIKGVNLISRASAVNKIKGGAVHLN